MGPANQGFKANNPARDKFDLRLIVEHELALVESLAQIGLARPAFVRGCGGAGAPRPASVLVEGFAKQAQFQMAGNHVRQVLQCADRFRLQLMEGLIPEDAQYSEDFSVGRAHGNACQRSHAHLPEARQERIALRMPGDFRNDERTVESKHHVEDRVCARQFANRMAPTGLDPDAAFIRKRDRGRISMEVLASQPRNGVVAGLG